jgi:hypothetical protein
VGPGGPALILILLAFLESATLLGCLGGKKEILAAVAPSTLTDT